MDEPDTNRLARGEKLDETIVKDKKDAREKNVSTAFRKKWNEPKVPEKREYPHNHVKETESGHVEEWDDTEGSNRYHRYHNAGTFVEVHDDGTEVRHVKKDKYEVILGDDHLLVKGDINITIEGNANLLVNGDVNTEVKGNHNEQVYGNYNLIVNGNMVAKVYGQYWHNGTRIHLNSSFAPKLKF